MHNLGKSKDNMLGDSKKLECACIHYVNFSLLYNVYTGYSVEINTNL